MPVDQIKQCTPINTPVVGNWRRWATVHFITRQVNWRLFILKIKNWIIYQAHIYLSIGASIFLHSFIRSFVRSFIHSFIHFLSSFSSIHPSIVPSVCLSVCLPACLSVCLSVCLSNYLSIYRLIDRFVHLFIIHSYNPLSYFSFQPVLHHWCNKGCGMCYHVCGMGHIKEPFLLIAMSSPCGGRGFPLPLSEWSFTMSDAI